ncbi:MAG TPA: EAL domain-containing protein [Leucothrix mucor]|nr:EAL domain-containing protein [Leucothrix mucor]
MSLRNLLPQGYKSVLPIGFTLIIFLMIFTSFFVAMQTKNSSELILETVKQHNLNSKLLNNMSQAVINRSIILVEMLQADDPFVIDELYIQLLTEASNVTVSRAEFMQQDHDDETHRLLYQQGSISRVNEPLQNQVYDLALNEEKEQAILLFSKKTLPLQKKNFELIKEMEAHQYLKAKKALQQSTENNYSVYSTVFMVDVSSILISILLALYLLKQQTKNNRELSVLATTDALTELPNRANFIENINAQISRNPQSIFAVIFFDIDYFKSINDNYGHEVGDEILRKFAAKLKSNIKHNDVLSRFGGDEFVLLLQSIHSKEEAITFISQLSESLDTSFMINNNEIFVSASIGASLYIKDGSDAKALLKSADIAMYSAKDSGRNCYQFFSKATSDRLEKEHRISHALHTVLKDKNSNKELRLVYQPLLNIAQGDMTECEALIRWTTADGEMVPADDFIALAEKSNLIEKINLFVIDEVCKQQCEWQRLGVKNMRININLSGNKTIFDKLLRQFKGHLKRLNLNPVMFGIELTERTLYEISQETIDELDEIRQQGMKISIDDFGTGYSSLSYLKKLPITTLKIDKEFIAGLPDDKDDQALVKTIIALGHALDLDVVAEGVETLEQLEFLKNHSCNIAQGYYFHRPLEHKQIPHLKLVA